MAAEKTAFLPVSTDEAFALITEPDRLRRWKTVSARVDLRAGGSYRFTVVPGHVAAGTYTEVDPGRRIVFGWAGRVQPTSVRTPRRSRSPSSPSKAEPWSDSCMRV